MADSSDQGTNKMENLKRKTMRPDDGRRMAHDRSAKACTHGAWKASMKRYARAIFGVVAALVVGLGSSVPARADTVFLEDGRIIEVDAVEVLGDRVRLKRVGEIIEIPKSLVTSIHTPRPAPPAVPPAAVYPGFVQQMTDRVRGEVESGMSPGPRLR